MPHRHISLRCIDALAPLGVVDDGKGLDYFIPDDALIKDNDLPTGHLFGYVALVIGATHNTKNFLHISCSNYVQRLIILLF